MHNKQQEKTRVMDKKRGCGANDKANGANNNNKGPTMHNNKDVDATQKIVHTETGPGHLALKNGKCEPVIWTLNILDNDEIHSGYVTGNKSLIKLAAKDKLAELKVTSRLSVAIAVDGRRADTISFTALLTHCDELLSVPFAAKAILALQPTGDGKSVIIEFVGARGERRTLVVPVRIIRDLIPNLEYIMVGAPGAAASPANAWKRWHIASALRRPVIYVTFGGDHYALTPKNARRLAVELVERADDMERRPAAVQQ